MGIFSYHFMQRALWSGILLSIACAMLGIFLILRREAMIGHGLSHIAFGGVAIGLFFHVLPMVTSLLVVSVAALGIVKIKEKAGVYEDTAIGIFSSIGMAAGIIIASLAGSFNVDLMSYLFGNILAISSLELWISLALTMTIFISIVLFYRELMFITFDPESAKASGMKVSRLESLLAILTAVTVVLGMKIVGLLLVTALLVIPSAAGLQVGKSFGQTLLLSILVASLSVFLGLIFSFYGNIPASGAIILIASLFFLSLFLFRILKIKYSLSG